MDGKTPPDRISPPVSYARKSADGFWYVAVTWGNGRQERLGPYKTEAVAEERIKAQLEAWHKAKSYFKKSFSVRQGDNGHCIAGRRSGSFIRSLRTRLMEGQAERLRNLRLMTRSPLRQIFRDLI
jgi:uncharacterized protein with von Willebrand factor type A (vWA) domain